MNELRLGSLCKGYGGLDMAVAAVLPVREVWCCEFEPPTPATPRPKNAAARLIEHRFPGLPNHGDVSIMDWTTVEPVDVLTAGFPCQDVSTAGLRAGLREGNRTGLWFHVARAVAELRPRLVVLENVRGLLSAEADCSVEPCAGCVGDGTDVVSVRALGIVLGDLASIGYDAVWCGVRASDVGAAHERFRVFIVAANTRDGGLGPIVGDTLAGEPDAARVPAADSARERGDWAGRVGPGRGVESTDGREPAADAASEGPQGMRPEPARRRLERSDPPVADTGHGNVAERARSSGRESVERPPVGTGLGSDRPTDWGEYRRAIERWERVTGCAAPVPTVAGRSGPVLSPWFAEWMMGLPSGHVCGVPGLSRSDMLKLIGNGVVPQQAAVALAYLLPLLAGVAS